MEPEQQITFGPFRLAGTPGRLWRGDQVIPLRPRSLAMLRYLAAHPGRLVTKAEVLLHVWAGTHVSDSVLRASVREIRIALGDAATCYLADVTWLCEESIEAAVHLPEDIARHVEWFTEGFDTVDIHEAKALLEELVA